MYANVSPEICDRLNAGDKQIEALARFIEQCNLDQFPGEFYRRPIFICEAV